LVASRIDSSSSTIEIRRVLRNVGAPWSSYF
jgi:hypothetical protein